MVLAHTPDFPHPLRGSARGSRRAVMHPLQATMQFVDDLDLDAMQASVYWEGQGAALCGGV